MLNSLQWLPVTPGSAGSSPKPFTCPYLSSLSHTQDLPSSLPSDCSFTRDTLPPLLVKHFPAPLYMTAWLGQPFVLVPSPLPILCRGKPRTRGRTRGRPQRRLGRDDDSGRKTGQCKGIKVWQGSARCKCQPFASPSISCVLLPPYPTKCQASACQLCPWGLLGLPEKQILLLGVQGSPSPHNTSCSQHTPWGASSPSGIRETEDKVSQDKAREGGGRRGLQSRLSQCREPGWKVAALG